MARFIEFIALCKEEKSKEELQLEKTLHGEVQDIFLPGFERYRITVDVDLIAAYNEGDSNCKNDCTVLELTSGAVFKIAMRYDEFKTLINTKS